MSEYQYYEFRAIDRPLNEAELKRVRALSTRAEITPVSFINEYHWGDFKGNPTKMMWDYYDAFLYLANWGTRRLMFRLPADLIDRAALEAYCTSDAVSLEVKGKHALLEFTSDEEEGEGWVDSGEGLLEEMLPLREAIIDGDLRALYLGWLAGVNERAGSDPDPDADEYADEEPDDDDSPEPPVPRGLLKRTPALNALVKFLRVPDDLLAVAAEASPEAPADADSTGESLGARVALLPESERNALLADLAGGEAADVRRRLLRRLREVANSPGPLAAAVRTGRTAGALVAAARQKTQHRLREAAERAARKRARLEAEAAAKREKYLDELAAREEAAWSIVESKVESKQQSEYDDAVKLLKDLRDVSVRGGALRSFESRVRTLHARHLKKSTFVKRLQKAGMLKWGGAG